MSTVAQMEVDSPSKSIPTSHPPASLIVPSDPDSTAANSPSGTNPAPSSRLTASPAGSSKDDACPACTGARKRNTKTTHWIECEACGSWFHWDCVSESGTGESLNAVDKWFCSTCIKMNPSFEITYKPAPRKSSRKRAQPSTSTSTHKWSHIIASKPIFPDKFKRMQGSDVRLSWLDSDPDALKEPVVVERPEGLGMKMPGWPSEEGPGEGMDGSEVDTRSLTVDEVARIVGGDTPVEVIDVATQSNSPSWTLSRWAEYYDSPPSERDKIRNVISLEVSGTPLAQHILAPRLVREIDWFHRFWPTSKRGKGQYPKVQLYCLMSVADCWTDMHVDFAGSSVFYHVIRGSKVFYFIRPTKANLGAYERWCGSEAQASTWLGDMVDEVIKVEVKQGQTMFIPTGWIHAVHTPMDSLVIGGNFLHSYNITTQLRVRDIEIKTRVPKKFRFPLFQRMCWYVCEAYNRSLKAKEDIPHRVLTELRPLSDFLMSEARLIEGGTDGNRKDAREMVPSDRVPDAPALAREFRWRIRAALDDPSGDDKPKPTTKANKRKRVEEDDKDKGLEKDKIFRNYTPVPWDATRREGETREVKTGVPLPGDWGVEGGGDGDGEMERSVESVVKIRRTGDVVERQVITRVKEVWRPS